MYNFFENARPHPVWCIFNADYDEFIEIYILSKKIVASARIRGEIISWEVKKFKMWK